MGGSAGPPGAGGKGGGGWLTRWATVLPPLRGGGRSPRMPPCRGGPDEGPGGTRRRTSSHRALAQSSRGSGRVAHHMSLS